MHIPDSLLTGPVCPVTATLSGVGLAAVALQVRRANTSAPIARVAVVSALVFALQMLNFPIGGGTSGHLLGGVLAAATLGIPLGILAMALVLVVQTLVFSDGGLLVLGANVLNMAFIGAGLGGLILAQMRKRLGLAATPIAAWCSVMAAALAVSVQIAVDGRAAFGDVAAAMLSTHAWIGIGEALLTMAALALFRTSEAFRDRVPTLGMPALAAVLAALVISPFASPHPDGLEAVTARLKLASDAAPAFVGVLPDYVLPGISSAFLSTGLAGLLGVLLTLAAGALLARLLTPRPA